MKRIWPGFLTVLLVLSLLPVTTQAVAGAHLEIQFDRGSYRPGDVAVVTVMAHGYPAGLASVTAELLYETGIFGSPTASADFLSGGLMEGATALEPIHAPFGVSINLSRATGASADTGGGAKLFTLHFPVLGTAPDMTGANIRFGPVTGLVPSGVLLLDASDNEIHTAENLTGSSDIWLGGSIVGQVSLLESTSGDFSGVSVSVPTAEIAVTTDTNGAFAIHDLHPGVHNLRLYKPGYLVTHVLNAVVVRGGTADLTNVALALVPGNIRDAANLASDTVFLEDLAGLARSIGTTSTSATNAFGTTWNLAADLDDDDSIGALDLAILAQNWGLNGPEGYGIPTMGTVVDLGESVVAPATLTVSEQPGSVEWGDAVQLQATLSNTAGVSVANKMIEFVVGAPFWMAATDANGIATVTIGAQWFGTHNFTASFAGDPTLAPASANGSFIVGDETASLTLPGLAFEDELYDSYWEGEPLAVRALLWKDSGGIADEPVSFSIAIAGGSEVLNSGPVSTVDGLASWTLAAYSLQPGAYELKAIYDGGDVYSATYSEVHAFTVTTDQQSNEPPTTTTVQLHVMDGSGNGLSGSQVTVSGSGDPLSETSDGNGYVQFDLPDGSYTYDVLAPEGYVVGVNDVSFTVPGVSSPIHVTLELAEAVTNYDVTINVTNSCYGVQGPVQGASVTAYGGGVTYGPLTTDPDGNVTFQLPLGTYTYDITATNYQSSLGLALGVIGVTSVTQSLVPDYCLASVKLYEGTFPNGTEVTTVSGSGGPYYVHAVFEGTPSAVDVHFHSVRDNDGDNVAETLGFIGSATIVGNEAHLSWDLTEQAPGIVFLVVQGPVNWEDVSAQITIAVVP